MRNKEMASSPLLKIALIIKMDKLSNLNWGNCLRERRVNFSSMSRHKLRRIHDVRSASRQIESGVSARNS